MSIRLDIIRVKPVTISCTIPWEPNPTANPITVALATYAVKEIPRVFKIYPTNKKYITNIRILVNKLTIDINFATDLSDIDFKILLLILLIIITSRWAPIEIRITNNIRPHIFSGAIRFFTGFVKKVNKRLITSILK